jgi:hypothetical protein
VRHGSLGKGEPASGQLAGRGSKVGEKKAGKAAEVPVDSMLIAERRRQDGRRRASIFRNEKNAAAKNPPVMAAQGVQSAPPHPRP